MRTCDPYHTARKSACDKEISLHDRLVRFGIRFAMVGSEAAGPTRERAQVLERSIMTDDDRWYARRLPVDFVTRIGDSYTRVAAIVAENWWQYEGRALTELIELLLPILERVKSQIDITEDIRGECERTVAAWIAGLTMIDQTVSP